MWSDKESFRVLKQKKGKGNVLELSLDMRMLNKEKLGASFELNDSQIEDRDMVINIRNSSSAFMNAIPSDLKLFTISLPSYMRNLSRLEILSMVNRKKLKSVKLPPRTLSRLFLFSHHGSFVKKDVLDPEMSPLELSSNWWLDFTPGPMKSKA
ncbi:unnamed protein product [Lactuca saligna]|uniref:Uncharacterized protein n=1 Tax=Lactuca saligna TaxID=75948 RepID=A0AA35VD16_LACSI|nr:unnamed protein product [Lactuca saligna]